MSNGFTRAAQIDSGPIVGAREFRSQKESRHRRKQASQGASLAHSLPLKTIALMCVAGSGLFVVFAAALIG
jgi:hypothetical protein